MNEQLKIALFGATGKTGIYYLEMALDKGHNIRAFVRDQKKLQKMVSKLKLDEVKLKKLEVIECDIFDSNTLNLSHIDLVVSCLGFHRRNNKAMKIDHYSRSMESILKAINEHNVGRIITMSSWYCQSRGDSLGGCFGCMATFFLRHMIGHVLIDMEKMYKILEEKSNKELQWQVICFPGLRKRSSDKKDMLWEVDNDYVREIVQKYPLYKMKYHTVPFYDAGQMMLMISEEKYGLPKNCLISVTNKF